MGSQLPLSLIGLPYLLGRRAAKTDYQMARRVAFRYCSTYSSPGYLQRH